jgi:hypothetical protein
MPKLSDMTDDALVSYISERASPTNAENATLLEMARRQIQAVKEFNAAASEQTAHLIALSESAGRQAQTMIRLTQWIIALTIILGVIAVLQLWAMLVKGA